MDVLTILGVLGALTGLGYLSVRIHRHAENTYGYRLLSLPKLLFMLVPIVLLLLGLWILPTDGLNGGVLLALAAASFVGFVVQVARRTNFWIASFTALVLLLAALLSILILVVAEVVRSQLKGNRRRRR